MRFKRPAQILSILFHPLLMITYGVWLFMLVNPYAFGVNHWMAKSPFLLMVFFMTFLFPAIIITMLWRLKLVSSLTLEQPKERIIPYIATGVFYLWMYVTTRSNPDLPVLFKSFMLGSVIALFLVFFINNFSKISAHMAGLAGFSFFSILLASGTAGFADFSRIFGETLSNNSSTLPAIALFVTGVTGLARLYLRAHTTTEIVGGLVVGVLGQIIAMRVYY